MYRGRFRIAGTSKMELFVIIFNGLQPLTTITKCSILGVAAVLDPPLDVNASQIWCNCPNGLKFDLGEL